LARSSRLAQVCTNPPPRELALPLMPASLANFALTERLRAWIRPPGWVALAAMLAALWTLSPSGSGPGITCDEGYYVATAKGYVLALRSEGWAFFRPEQIDRTMGFAPDGPPPHPPLGLWILGWTHWLLDPAPDRLEVVSIVAARLAAAVAMGGLVLVVGRLVARPAGEWIGGGAALVVALCPRVFAHGHVAGLDILVTVFILTAILAIVKADAGGGKAWHYALAGVVWGLALLTKINGILLLVPVAGWLIWRLRRKAAVPLLAWGGAGLGTLVAGWPWLWQAPLERLLRYVASGTERPTLHTFYLGRVWQDVDVPWHYPWVMLLTTVPIGLLALGIWGLWKQIRSKENASVFELAAANLLFTLVFFSLPGMHVYDGERLFLTVYPLLAILAGLGLKELHQLPRVARFPARTRALVLAAFFASQGVGLVWCHPFQLSYYNLVVGGLWGAEKLGFEPTYWGDSVQGDLLAEAGKRCPQAHLLFGPSLAPYQVASVVVSSPELLENDVRLIGWDPTNPRPAAECRHALIYRRKADLGPLAFVLEQGEVIAENSVQGVWLARLYRLPATVGELNPMPAPLREPWP
jgi:4-amino-4-deoxy-L-arabinose transferase-like glycosyltransferase